MAGLFGDASRADGPMPEGDAATSTMTTLTLPPLTPSTTATANSPTSSYPNGRSTNTSATPFTPGSSEAAPQPPLPAPAKPLPAAVTTPPSADAVPTAEANMRQRSSVACLHCRRSKIRCVNTGIDTLCNTCRHANRECKYAVEIAKRSRLGVDDGDRLSKRNKGRKGELLVDGSRKGESGMGIDRREEKPNLVEDGVLDPTLLTPQVWSELFGIFERHFGTDLPFLHSPTFSKRLREAPDLHPASDAVSEPRSAYDPEHVPGWEILILGILVLTARFHPQVVSALCSDRGKARDLEAIHASEYYAVFLRALLVGSGGSYIGSPDLAKVQGLLMLASYEWSTCQGAKAWIHVGLATRMAQALGLQFEDDADFQPYALASMARIDTLQRGIGEHTASSPSDPLSGDSFVEEEVRRRTFWSCFMMDRYLSSGKYRPSMLVPYDLRLQLPCSQNAFLFRNRVCTEYLNGACSGAEHRLQRKARERQRWMHRRGLRDSDGATSGASAWKDFPRRDQDLNIRVGCEYGPSESVLSVYVRAAEIWGQIAKWACCGGIRNERYAPWNPSSEFYRLRDTMLRFEAAIPRLHQLSKNNVEAHIAQQTTQPFLLLQVLLASSTIILHRELLPFVPLRCTAPQGPWYQSPFSQEPPMPYGFYVNSARQLFAATRDILDLVQACQGRCTFPETPASGFGLYVMTFMAIYAAHYPHMDSERAFSGMLADRAAPNSIWKGVSVALEIISEMRTRHPMADNWFRTIHRVHHYYERITQDAMADSRAGLTHSALFVEHLPPREQMDEITRSFRQLGIARDEHVDEWSAAGDYSSLGMAKTEEAVSEDQPNRALRRTDAGSRPASAGFGPGDSHQYSWTPMTERLQTSPTANGPMYASSDPAHHRTLSNHTMHATSSGPSPTWSHAAPPPSGRYQQLPPLVPASAPLSTEHGAGLSRRAPFWLVDLEKTLSADDVAAFMDSLSCQEWVQSIEVVHATWGGRDGGWKGAHDGDDECGWLGRIWWSPGAMR